MAMSAAALILVIDAVILASMQSPDLPDDFRKSQGTTSTELEVSPPNDSPTPVEVAPVLPTIEFSSAAAQASPGLAKSAAKITERWLVTTEYCSLCRPAKARFIASGGKQENIISPAQALELHGRTVTGVPFEYTTESEVSYSQPPEYRLASRMEVTLDGSHTPTKQAILNHLRRGKPHQGKHWQSWYLESWQKEQLYALHDDDHFDRVPTFDVQQAITATVSNAPAPAEAIAAALSVHLHQHQGIPSPAFSSFFNVDVDVPDSARKWIADLLSKQYVEFPSAGVWVGWQDKTRTMTVAPGRVSITPGAIVRVKKSVVQLTATLDAIAYADDLSWVTLELGGAPDLTVRLK